MELKELIIRVLLSIVFLTLIAKLNGAKQVSQLTFYDYVAGIVIGALAAEVAMDHDIPITYGIIAMLIYAAHSMLIAFLSRKSIMLHRVLVGEPILLMARGEIQMDALKRAKVDLSVLLSELRGLGYFDIGQVNYAILEPGGHLSVLPKDEARPVTAADFSLPRQEDSLQANVVIDGKVMERNLNAFQKERQWLLRALAELGYGELPALALVTMTSGGRLTVHEKKYTRSTRTSLL